MIFRLNAIELGKISPPCFFGILIFLLAVINILPLSSLRLKMSVL
ncbi:hypothetical protein ymoll0001_38640 [Yersinia mollaretii ATCC 43969]|uniref:Uncharacterized protein n=1 Tax=Yersinia mollaretii (strain ATCC 43969 / DSM 18520 / CIP 103324 / CNY 7263 / WAIP 204) TaxID=349967 RepID=A0ABP2EGI1_YERMW|nr:hypothetical protein ymoll0001_38640 [Yersinia mollaretii ATCC 43969]